MEEKEFLEDMSQSFVLNVREQEKSKTLMNTLRVYPETLL